MNQLKYLVDNQTKRIESHDQKSSNEGHKLTLKDRKEFADQHSQTDEYPAEISKPDNLMIRIEENMSSGD